MKCDVGVNIYDDDGGGKDDLLDRALLFFFRHSMTPMQLSRVPDQSIDRSIRPPRSLKNRAEREMQEGADALFLLLASIHKLLRNDEEQEESSAEEDDNTANSGRLLLQLIGGNVTRHSCQNDDDDAIVLKSPSPRQGYADVIRGRVHLQHSNTERSECVSGHWARAEEDLLHNADASWVGGGPVCLERDLLPDDF
jgi:hypothetical protein